jgi:hypothetical protein
MHLTRYLPPLFLVVVAGFAHADTSGLQRCRAVTDNMARLACYDALLIAPSTTPPVVSAPVASTSAAKAEAFGLEQKRAAASEAPSLDSAIAGRFEGWGPRSRITLANGQVWQVADDSSAALNLDNPKVLVRRGVLGAFYLEIDGTNRSPKVRRLQ